MQSRVMITSVTVYVQSRVMTTSGRCNGAVTCHDNERAGVTVQSRVMTTSVTV